MPACTLRDDNRRAPKLWSALAPETGAGGHTPHQPGRRPGPPPVSICTTFSRAMRRCTSSGLLGGSALRSPSTSSSGLRGAGGWGGWVGSVCVRGGWGLGWGWGLGGCLISERQPAVPGQVAGRGDEGETEACRGHARRGAKPAFPPPVKRCLLTCGPAGPPARDRPPQPAARQWWRCACSRRPCAAVCSLRGFQGPGE